MHDKPAGAALLDVARQTLVDEIAPALTGHSRYVALMVANAIGIVSREIEKVDDSAEAWELALSHLANGEKVSAEDAVHRLVEAIRRGRYDADPNLHAALVRTAAVAAGIWKPDKA
jgi:hypothetical protein